MDDIARLLKGQKEVEDLCYLYVFHEKHKVYEIFLSAYGWSRKIKTRDKDACVSRIIDILFELKEKIAWQKKQDKLATNKPANRR